jgi:2-oxoglutarate dehydrogenase E2 component (dihydrolipoamide succinyltransferase)
MVNSYYQAPHAFLVTEVDITHILEYIAREREAVQQKHGFKLTITPFFVEAVSCAVQKFPMMNASLDQETIIVKKHVNIGLAVNLQDDGLIVPVIKDCQQRDMLSIAQAIADLSKRAREGQLKPQEVTEGTITVTNFGMSGALIGLPIIRYPEAAIVAIGAIRKTVKVLEDESFGVRSTVHITLAFDHRIVDGMYAGGFIAALKQQLEGAVAK